MQNRITPTHFVEFYRMVEHPKCMYSKPDLIEELKKTIDYTQKLEGLKTIAILYIQYTDVPLSERLAKRGIKMIND